MMKGYWLPVPVLNGGPGVYDPRMIAIGTAAITTVPRGLWSDYLQIYCLS